MQPTFSKPALNEIRIFDQYSLISIVDGSGTFEVDFATYTYGKGKAIFLAPGQYFRLVQGDLQWVIHEFPTEVITSFKSTRYLFKHLVSLGYIEEPQLADDSQDEQGILENSVNDWLNLNPFGATATELEILFDVKDYIDQHYVERNNSAVLSKVLSRPFDHIQRITKQRLQLTIKRLHSYKLLEEAKKKLAFTVEPTKQVATQLGFAHTSYLHKFFKTHTASTPDQFRQQFEAYRPDPFMEDFNELLNQNFREEHFLGFYADRFFMTPKTLSRKIKRTFGCGFNELLNTQILGAAERQLKAGVQVKEVAFDLGFEEPNHFSAYFRQHRGQSPTAWLN